MPTFYLFEGIKICLYFGDHNPPHFHAFYGEYEVLIDIKNATLLKGDMPKKQLNKIIQFAGEKESELLEIWENLQS